MERVAVFIDGTSFYFFQKEGLGWWIDPKRLLAYINSEFPHTDSRPCPAEYPQTYVDIAYYYWISNGSPQEEAFSKHLTYSGYSLRRRIWTDEDARFRRVPIMLCEMIVDIVSMMDSYDHAVIICGDNDIARTLELLRDRNKKFTVMGVKTCVGRDIWELVGPNFIHLNEIQPLIEKQGIHARHADYLDADEEFNEERLASSVSFG